MLYIRTRQKHDIYIERQHWNSMSKNGTPNTSNVLIRMLKTEHTMNATTPIPTMRYIAGGLYAIE